MHINKCQYCKFFEMFSMNGEENCWCFLCNEDEEDCMDYEENK